MNQAKISAARRTVRKPVFQEWDLRLFAQKQAPDFTPAGIGQKAEADGKPERVCALRPAGRARVAAMRGPLDSRRPCTTLVPQERQRRRPLRGIFEAVCPLPRPEPRPRLGASAGQGAPAEALSRRMSCHVHTYIRSRAGCFVARPRAYALTARCITHMLFRCSIARIRVHSGGRDRLAAEAVDALLRSRAYILY